MIGDTELAKSFIHAAEVDGQVYHAGAPKRECRCQVPAASGTCRPNNDQNHPSETWNPTPNRQNQNQDRTPNPTIMKNSVRSNTGLRALTPAFPWTRR